MNCSRFRFLIQQWFDTPLSPQDERMLVAHVDSCDSCARFQHQLDQVVQGTPDVPLPDECLPSNLESLAKRIMDQIPQEKPGFLGMLKNMLPKFGGGAGGGKQQKPGKAAGKKVQEAVVESDDSLSGGSMFPHVRRKAGEEAKAGKKGNMQPIDEELLATSTRLKTLGAKLQPPTDEPQAQSQGLSLGSKFGVNVPMRDSGQSDDGPLTLAESIRRKVVEEKTGDGQATSGSQNFPPQGGFNYQGAPEGGFQQQSGQFAGGFSGQPGMPPNFQPQNIAQPGQSAPPAGGAPMVGQWGEPAAAPPPQPGNWGDPPRPGVGGDSDWRPLPPVQDWSQAAPQTGGWSGAPGQPGQAPEAAPGQPGWGSAWPEGAPDPNAEAQARRGQTNAGWGDQQATSGSQNWGQPAAPGWGDPQTNSGNQGNWGQQFQPPAGWEGQPGAATPAPAPAPGWGQPAGNAGWGEQPAQPVQPPAGAPGWGQTPQAAPGAGNQGWQAPASNWSAPPPQPGAPAPAQGSWGAPPPAPAGWGAPPQPSGWGAPATTPGAEPGWTNQSGVKQPGSEWAVQPAQQPPAGVNPFLTPAAAPAPPQPASEFETGWSEEGEQIQTGMWQAFTLAEPELGQPKAPSQMGGGLPLPKPGSPLPPVEGGGLAAAAAGKTDPSMFDIPIQERMKMQQQAAAAAPAEAGSDASRFDVPIQQRGAQGAPPPAPAANPSFAAPPVPPVPPMGAPQPVAAAGGGKNSIMDRLNKVLGDDLAAMAGGQPPVPNWQPGSAPPVPETPAMPPVPAPFAPPPAPMPAAAAAQPVAAAAPASGLMKLDDAAVDKVFAENLGVTEAVRPVQAQAAPAMAPPMPAPAPAQAPVPPPVPPLGGPRISAVPPRPVSEAPAPAAAAPAAAPAADGGLFRQLDDRAMDQIFASNLGVKDETAPVAHSAAAPAPPPPVPPMQPQYQPAQPPAPPVPPLGAAPATWNQAPAPQPAAPAAAPAPRGSGLLNVDDDAMDRIFADLGVKDKGGGPKINVREAVNQIRNLADVPTPPKVEGISRLSREETVAEPTPGKINAIGKFLLDQQDFAKIGRLTEQDLSDTKVRVLTHEASDEINRLLEHIATQPGVVGSVIVGHDGILIASSLPKEHDPETIGIFSLGIYINTTNTSKKMGHNHLHQLVCRTAIGYLVVADFGGGILVTVSNALETEKLIPLMRSITQLVAQS